MISNAHALPWRTLLTCGLASLLATSAAVAKPPAPKVSRTTISRPVATPEQAKTHDSREEPSAEPEDPDAAVPTIDVVSGMRTGQLAAEAEGLGDGRMTLTVTNRSSRKLRVVLPPGLVAAGATGQFGGMGGMGGGMGMMGGGMGMMGGGMGGGMGMMGGGMGGMGGGMGGRGGMMGGRGGGMSGGTLPPMMGMMMLGRLIMNLIGDRDSWDQRSLMTGMMGMGGMGMMGGGMGMMGGGMGGMGGGFRSVPPTSLPFTTLKPHQTRHLPTGVVSLDGPNAAALPSVPQKGEKLRVLPVEAWTHDVRAQSALMRLAEEKAPQTVTQLVLWHVASGLAWVDIEDLAKGWANPSEIALARQFVERLAKEGQAPRTDSGVLYWEVVTNRPEQRTLADAIEKWLSKGTVVGLRAVAGFPSRPSGPCLACRIVLSGTAEAPKVSAELLTVRGEEPRWAPLAVFSPSLPDEAKTDLKAARLLDEIAGGIADRLVQTRLAKGPRVKGKETYKIKILNASPLILNGLALAGAEGPGETPPSVVSGMCVPPHKTLTLPATAELVARLGLKNGTRVVAVDLSGL